MTKKIILITIQILILIVAVISPQILAENQLLKIEEKKKKTSLIMKQAG